MPDQRILSLTASRFSPLPHAGEGRCKLIFGRQTELYKTPGPPIDWRRHQNVILFPILGFGAQIPSPAPAHRDPRRRPFAPDPRPPTLLLRRRPLVFSSLTVLFLKQLSGSVIRSAITTRRRPEGRGGLGRRRTSAQSQLTARPLGISEQPWNYSGTWARGRSTALAIWSQGRSRAGHPEQCSCGKQKTRQLQCMVWHDSPKGFGGRNQWPLR